MKKNDYNLIGFVYDLIAKIIFANRIHQSQLALLGHLKPKSKILFIGGGSGSILNEVFKISPDSTLVYLEKSAKMISLAKEKCLSNKQVSFILGDENSIPKAEFDVILSFYFLDQFNPQNQKEIFNKINSCLIKNGLWFVADFNPAANSWQKIIEKGMFLFLKLTSQIESSQIPEIKHLFKKEKFIQVEERAFFNNYIFSSIYRKR